MDREELIELLIENGFETTEPSPARSPHESGRIFIAETGRLIVLYPKRKRAVLQGQAHESDDNLRALVEAAGWTPR